MSQTKDTGTLAPIHYSKNWLATIPRPIAPETSTRLIFMLDAPAVSYVVLATSVSALESGMAIVANMSSAPSPRLDADEPPSEIELDPMIAAAAAAAAAAAEAEFGPEISLPEVEPPDPAAAAAAPILAAAVAVAAARAGVAVTPSPWILTGPVWTASSTGQVMVCVLCAHTSQVTTVLMKFGGTGGRVHVAGSPVHTSLMV
jgi:hypothetical protein